MVTSAAIITKKKKKIYWRAGSQWYRSVNTRGACRESPPQQCAVILLTNHNKAHHHRLISCESDARAAQPAVLGKLRESRYQTRPPQRLNIC